MTASQCSRRRQAARSSRQTLFPRSNAALTTALEITMASRNRNQPSPARAPISSGNSQHPTLAIADHTASPNSKTRLNASRLKKGYDPYDSGQLTKAGPSRRRDVRRLGEWLKSVEGKKN